MAEKIAEYFGQLKFVVDDKGLKSFVQKLEDLAKQMKDITKTAGGGSTVKAVASGMEEIGKKAKSAAKNVEQSTTKIVESTKKLTRAQIREKEKLDKALSKPSSKNPLTEIQQKIKVKTQQRASKQGQESEAERKRLDAWFEAAARKEQALMKSSSAAYRRASALGSRQVGGIVANAQRNVAARSKADAAELARYEAWFGKAESRDERLGIASGKDFRRSQAAGSRSVAAVLADVQAAKQLREKRERADGAREMRDNLRAQRRAETASREDERRFQNRVSRTYAPKASRMALYQADLVRTQAAYNAAMAAGGQGAARYAEAIKKLKREIIGLKYEQSRLRGGFGLRSGAINSALTPMLGMAAAGGAAGLGYGAVAITDQLVKQQNISAQFQGLYGSEAAGQAGYGRFKEYANMRGVRQAQIAQDYLGFMYSAKTNIGLEGANKIFENFTDLARVRGTSGERYQRALAALSQMTSKNRIYSEELTQQLSEHLFGSKEIFAEVITGKKGGDAMTELLKRMKSDAGVVTAEWLPKVSEEMARLAKESGVLDKMSNNLDASLARLNNRWWDFIAAMDELGTGEKIGSVIDQIADGLKDLTQWMRENQDTVEMLTESLRTFFSILFSRYTVIFMAVAGFVALANGVAKAAAAIRLLGIAGAIASAPMLVLIGLIGLVALAIEDVYSWAKGDESILAYWIGDSSEYFIPLFDFIDDMKKRWSDAIDFVTGKWNAFKDLVNQPIEYAEKLWGRFTNTFGGLPVEGSSVMGTARQAVAPALATSTGVSFGQVNVYANDANSFYRDLNAYYPKVPK